MIGFIDLISRSTSKGFYFVTFSAYVHTRTKQLQILLELQNKAMQPGVKSVLTSCSV